MGIMANRVVVIPVAISEYTLGSAKTALNEGASLFLGAPRDRLQSLRADFFGHNNVCCEELDPSSSEQVTAFFERAYARFRQFDCLLLTDEIWQSQRNPEEQGVRTLLQCLNAIIPRVRNELHIITVTPNAYRRAVATTVSILIRAQLRPQFPTIRMTAISSTGTAELPEGPAPLTHVAVGPSGRCRRREDANGTLSMAAVAPV